MKKIFSLMLILSILLCTVLSSCEKPQIEVKSKRYYDYFDTECIVMSYAGDSAEDFIANANMVENMLKEYHQFFDIYYEYEGINNLCTLNKNAGKGPVKLDKRIIDFLIYCVDMYEKTSGETNIMLGSVLKLWHDARDADVPYVPDTASLIEAAEHTNIYTLIIDDVNMTAEIIDPLARVDVGAIAKGYTAEMCTKRLTMFGVNSYVLNFGGNIRTIGTKHDGSAWGTGINDPFNTNPFETKYITKVKIANTSCVTSGDYQRYYYVGNQKYHHIIDFDTLYPANYYTSVTIIAEDSGLADALSTALFCMTYEEGLATISSFDEKIEVLWIYPDGTMKSTDGFKAIEFE